MQVITMLVGDTTMLQMEMQKLLNDGWSVMFPPLYAGEKSYAPKQHEKVPQFLCIFTKHTTK